MSKMLAELFSMTKHLMVGVFYASQTGTAKSVAEIIKNKMGKYIVDVVYGSLDELKIESLNTFDVIVFCIATTGKGEFPDNSYKFWNKVRKIYVKGGCGSGDVFGGMEICLLGLGSSEYTSFCGAAKALYKRLEKNGIKELVETLYVDEVRGDMEEVIDNWIEHVVKTIKKKQMENQNLFIKMMCD